MKMTKVLCFSLLLILCFGTQYAGATAVGPTWYHDGDSDLYGDPDDWVMATEQPIGYVVNSGDCDDGNAAVYPGALEYCNSMDDNCDGSIDEGVTNTYYIDQDGDGYGNASSTIEACTPPNGYVVDNTDCDDSNNAVHPGATEVFNGIDDDCDGSADEDANTYYEDSDSDGYGNSAKPIGAYEPPPGYVVNSDDCDDTDAAVNPNAREVCNGIDDDCDGLTDEGLLITYYEDFDGDGYGDSEATTGACEPPQGYVADSTDCDDRNEKVHPGAIEIKNGIDDNCDGIIDCGIKGDVNGDKKVDTKDLDIMLANLNKPVPIIFPCADLNGDGKITILDIRQLVAINPLLARDTRVRRLLGLR
jgi:hypothetical protein